MLFLAVIDASKAHLPSMSCSFEHQKMHLIVGDGFEYLKDKKNEFDVIITDSSDPAGRYKCQTVTHQIRYHKIKIKIKNVTKLVKAYLPIVEYIWLQM